MKKTLLKINNNGIGWKEAQQTARRIQAQHVDRFFARLTPISGFSESAKQDFKLIIILSLMTAFLVLVALYRY